jgi:anaerobic selenocysteine-containing dehydrogenase
MGPWEDMPSLPDFWPVIESADETHPFRLVTSPARSFLNTTFVETRSSVKREGRPTLKIHPDDAAALLVAAGDEVLLGNGRGEVRLHAEHFAGVKRGVVVAEGIWPNAAHAGGRGINTLIGADPIAPFGGAAFHDTRVWIRKG